jgi:subfamily B ATP-binding cassette protein MsbA
VIKGYHAEEREENVFAAGVQRVLRNVLKSLTVMSLMSLSATVLLGLIGASVMYVVPVVLPSVQSEFGVSRADASL